jgi:predicted thioesterase
MTDLAKMKPGLTGIAQILVGVEHTAPSIGSGKVPVLATPVMISVIEAAALAAVEHLPGTRASASTSTSAISPRRRSECTSKRPPS